MNPADFYSDFEKKITIHKEYAILPHYNPDPDALGSAFALKYLLQKKFDIKSEIYFQGVIGRAENRAMLEVLDIPLRRIENGNKFPELPVILLDTQPRTGNNPLPDNVKPYVIIDHHPIHVKENGNGWVDIRLDYGSTCTIIFDYFKAFKVKPVKDVATAMYYGIQTDVVGEGRRGYKVDYLFLEKLSILINRTKLFNIENPKLPFDYYLHINKGLENSIIYEDLLISSLGEIENPDYISEFADFLVRFDKLNFVLVMGIYNGAILISFRSQKRKSDAGMVLRRIVGRLGSAGGHQRNAGGRIVLENGEELTQISTKIISRAIKIIHGKITTGVPFLSLGDYLNIKGGV